MDCGCYTGIRLRTVVLLPPVTFVDALIEERLLGPVDRLRVGKHPVKNNTHFHTMLVQILD